MPTQCCSYRAYCHQWYASVQHYYVTSSGKYFLLLMTAFFAVNEKKKTTFLRGLCFSEPSQMRARCRSVLRMRWHISFMSFSWKQNTWCGKYIPLSCPLLYLGQVFLYTVIAQKCIVSSYQEKKHWNAVSMLLQILVTATLAATTLSASSSSTSSASSTSSSGTLAALPACAVSQTDWMLLVRIRWLLTCSKRASKMQRRFRVAVPVWTFPAYVAVSITTTLSLVVSRRIAIRQTKHVSEFREK